MSIVFYGKSTDLNALIPSVINYDMLCNDTTGKVIISQIKDCDYSIATESNRVINIITKYFTAKLHACIVTEPEEEIDRNLSNDAMGSAEGFVVVLPFEKNLDESCKRRLENLTLDSQDLSVKLLISLKHDGHHDELDQDERLNRIQWSLDFGYEHIEIDVVNITDGWQDREKEGLPRLMEALHSNTWSTMIPIDQAVPKKSIQLSKPLESSLAKDKLDPAVKDKEKLIQDNEELDEEITEEKDNEMFKQFENILSRAKEYHNEAVSRSATDEERRNRAEDVARAMASMLSIDGKWDDDSD
jgi:hypothetical protein